MNIRTKLLLSLFMLSTIVLVVGMVFYIQLRNLIEPLTPQSIPRSIDKLEKSIESNNLIFRILEKGQNIQYNLGDYVLTDSDFSLKDYYMNRALALQLLELAKKINPSLEKELRPEMEASGQNNEKIIQLMQENNFPAARQLLSSNKTLSLRNNIRSILNKYYLDFDIQTNENAIVMTKIAAKNTIQILSNSLRTTVIIFLEAMFISLIFAFISARTIAKPIDLLCKNMNEITSENFDIPVNPKLLKLKGDVGNLARAFVKLINRLQATTVSRNSLLLEIDRRIETEKNLRLTAQHLEESNRELDQFAYSAAHDLRSPLRGIESLAEWIKEDCGEILPEASREHLESLKKRARRLDGLINGILEYARVGRTNINQEPVNLNTLLDEIIDTLTPPAHIHITIDVTLPTVTANQALITQVFLNLINNAIKFNDKEKGEIHIGYKNLKNHYQFYVSDNGPGIDPRFHKKIFEIFQTLQPRDTIEGAGIGLALVKKIIEKQGGKLDIKSTVGEGTTFYFTWPKEKKN